MIRNDTLDILHSGGSALGVVLRYERGPQIARIMHSCGFNWLFMDLEHSTMPLDTVAAISVASLDVGITPMVRVPVMDLGTAVRALDNGALGVFMPHVEDAEQASAIASAFRYPPHGHRSFSSGLPQFRFRPPAAVDACRLLDAATLVAVMLETPQSIENADAIAAVHGIDALLIGASDLTAEMGIHGQFNDPKVMAMFEKVTAAARRHGKFAGIGGIGGVGEQAVLARCRALGMQLILMGTDLTYLMTGATAHTTGLRAAIDAPLGRT